MRFHLALALALTACGDSTPGTASTPVPDATTDAPLDVLGLNDPYARAAPSGGVSAVYMGIENGTASADTLLGARSDVAGRVEIHQTEDVGDGLSGMTPVEGGLPVPAGGAVTLEPGGLHVMLLDLQRDLAEGDTLDLDLDFAGRGLLPVRVPVRGVGS